ncbi:alanine racemase [Frigoribacterium sp. CG_9.8]|uniref:alanine racemase n=1 Tax=Frigoribacterium sp. CG_9.8 TaxID=2787733 RepID=UPI0018CB72C9|nr:alanine racemase [Frigoribacterium sp. CG_9.8]MBG6107350.1 alanine racemase [Frigoribacterium sp. CG_9.8]
MTQPEHPTSAVYSSLNPTPLATRIVDHGAIARNIGRIREITATPILAVVKADGFGHGIIEVATTALRSGAAWLGIATVDEALALRSAGIDAPVLCWLADPWCDLRAAIAQDVTISCANVETLEAVAVLGCTAEVHLELDTGMSRGGAGEENWNSLFTAAVASSSVRVTGLWSHLALATHAEPEATTAQVQSFERGVARARALGLAPGVLHLANSAGALEHPDTWFDLVRCGAALYGIETVVGRGHDLEPAMRVVSRVTQRKRISAGTGVSYNHDWVASADTTLVLVPVGYGDGIPRDLSHGGEVVIDGVRHPVVGAISMDQLIVDVGDAVVTLGDEVVLLGSPAAGEPDPQEWGAVTGTIAHEILTGLGGRMARRHTNQTQGTIP